VRNDREVNKFEWFDRNSFTDAMLEKHQSKSLRSVTDFRIVKQHINNAVKARKITAVSRRLREFAERPELGVEHLSIESAQTSASARKIAKSATDLNATIADLEVDQFVGEESMWTQLLQLSDTIRKKLQEAGWRLDK
jgi:hypothetical protein